MSKSSKEIREEIRLLCAEIFEIKPEEIKDDTHFIKDLGLDSMDAIELLAAIEKKYRRVIPEESLKDLVTLDAIVSIVENLLGAGKER